MTKEKDSEEICHDHLMSRIHSKSRKILEQVGVIKLTIHARQNAVSTASGLETGVKNPRRRSSLALNRVCLVCE